MELDVIQIPELMTSLTFDNEIGCDEDTGADDYLIPFDNEIGCDEDTGADDYLTF